MNTIQFSDFAKVVFKVGKIIEAQRKEGSEKLIRMVVDFGPETGKKVILSGISKFYEPEYLVNKKTVFVMNVEPRKIMDEVSEAMLFAADKGEHEDVSILILDKDVPEGSSVY